MNHKLKKFVPQLLTLLFVVSVIGFFTINAQLNMDERGIDFVLSGLLIPSLTGSIDFTPTPTFLPATTKTSYSWKNIFCSQRAC